MTTAKKAAPGKTARPAKPAAASAPAATPAAAPAAAPTPAPAQASVAPARVAPKVKAKPKAVIVAAKVAAKVAAVSDAEPQVAKPKRVKLIRDGFTIPKDEYLALEALKLRAAGLSSPSKKSELLRAGIKALAAMPDKTLLAALGAVPSVKTGRPGKD